MRSCLEKYAARYNSNQIFLIKSYQSGPIREVVYMQREKFCILKNSVEHKAYQEDSASRVETKCHDLFHHSCAIYYIRKGKEKETSDTSQ